MKLRLFAAIIVPFVLMVGCQGSGDVEQGTIVAELKSGSVEILLDQPRLWGLMREDFVSLPAGDNRSVRLEEVRVEGGGENYHLVADGQLTDGNDRIKAYPLLLVVQAERSVLVFPEDGA